MSKIRLILGVILVISLLIFGSFFYLFDQKKQSTSVVHYSGAVLPHHILAKDFIDDFIARLSYIPDKIYVIGPNHPEIGNSLVITNQNLETLELLKLGFIQSNDQIISQEHSVNIYQEILISKYPQSQIIPLIISSNINLDKMENLINYLYQNSTDKTLIICSTDFSHYRSLSEANSFDQKSLNFITQKKYSEIFNLNNDFIDSPKSLIIVLKTLDKLGKNHLTVLNHSNAAIINQEFNSPSTTSYFELGFE